MENQLTLIDICKSIRDAVLTKASEVTVYSSWSAEFGYEEIVNFPDRLKNTKWFRYIDPNEFSLDELEELNFSRWDEHSGLRLIPLWLLPYSIRKQRSSALMVTKFCLKMQIMIIVSVCWPTV